MKRNEWLPPGAQRFQMAALPEPVPISLAGRRIIRWLEIPAVLALFGLAAWIFVPTLICGERPMAAARLACCTNNLSQLWKMQANYAASSGGRSHLYPSDTGGAFWTALTRTAPPLIDPTLTDIFD